MKLYLIACLSACCLFSCSQANMPCNGQAKAKKNDLSNLNLNGKVRSVTDFTFRFEKNDSALIDDPTNTANTSASCEDGSSIIFDNLGNEIVKYSYSYCDTVYCDTCTTPLVVPRFSEKTIKEYDKHGNLIQKYHFSVMSDTILQSMRSCKYDCMNNKVEQIDRNYGPEFSLDPGSFGYNIKKEWRYTYDESGHVAERLFFENNNKDDGVKEVYTYDSLDNLLETRFYRGGANTGYETYVYDSKKNIVKKNSVVLKGERTFNESITFVYDDKNNIVKEGDWTYQYEYDSKGNWIKKKFFRSDLKPYFIKRKIEYYE
jgi:hypothetical protein